MPLTDTFGELQFRIWLEQVGKVAQTQAEAAAAGWGGDRIALVEKGSTFGIVMITKWDTPGRRDRVRRRRRAVAQAPAVEHGDDRSGSTNQVVLFVASDEATINALAAALGLAG